MPKLYYVARSSIHGKGVFAARDIKKGEVVGHYASRATKIPATRNRYVLEVYDDDGEFLEFRLGTNDFKYVNHSSSPNLEMWDDDLKMVATRNIRRDEELFWYYGDEFEEECGSD